MIRRLRRRHRALTAILVPATAGLFLAALAWRAELPAPAPEQAAAAAAEAWPDLPITVRAAAEADARRAVLLAPSGPLVVPDPLVYWGSEPVEPGGALPVDAAFLGRYDPEAGARLSVPSGEGALILYALARQEVVSSMRLGR